MAHAATLSGKTYALSSRAAREVCGRRSASTGVIGDCFADARGDKITGAGACSLGPHQAAGARGSWARLRAAFAPGGSAACVLAAQTAMSWTRLERGSGRLSERARAALRYGLNRAILARRHYGRFRAARMGIPPLPHPLQCQCNRTDWQEISTREERHGRFSDQNHGTAVWPPFLGGALEDQDG